MSAKVLYVFLHLVVFVCCLVPQQPREVETSPHEKLTTVTRNVSATCLSHVSHWLSQLRNGEPWALHMLDASTKLPEGALLGGKSNLGIFDQCLAVNVHDDVAEFQGQFCRAWMDVNVSNSVLETPRMIYAMCLPSSCPPEEIPDLMRNYIGPGLDANLGIDFVNPNDCYVKGKPLLELDTGGVVAISLLCVLTFVVVMSALLEWWLPDKTPDVLRAFSVTNTCRDLFNISKHPADISCLHGLRAGSMLWVILGHRYGQEQWEPKSNPDFIDTYFQHPLTMTILNGMVSVDTLFLLSGLLLCTTFLLDMERRSSFDVIKFYVYRYFRIALPIASVILIYTTILPLIGNGPLWNNYFYKEARNCKANWWTNIIFVNNYINQEGFSMCLGQTWYTAVDMQLAWLSPLVLLPLYYSRRAGLQLMGLLILISCFIPFTVTYIWKFTMSVVQVPIEIDMEGVPEGNMGAQIYHATQSRATPYLCGILLGYYLFKTRKSQLLIKEVWVYLGWILNTVMMLTIIYSLYIPHQPGYVYDRVGSAFYAGFHRLGWSAGIAWIILACVNGYGGIIDKILSWRYLLPVSRLTYGAFLVHFIVLYYDSATKRTKTFFSDYSAVHAFVGDFVPVYLLSAILYLLVEGPVLKLLKIAFREGKETKKKNIAELEKNEDTKPKEVQIDKH